MKNSTKPHRPTIGFMTFHLDQASSQVWSGVEEIVHAHSGNLICYSGGALRYQRYFQEQQNILYELVDKERFDGLVICSSTLETFISREEMEGFMRRYLPLPVVSQGTVFSDVPSIIIDDCQGILKLVEHLLQQHEYRHIGFLRGPVNAFWAQNRYQAYLDALKNCELPYKPEIVSVPCAGSDEAAKRFVQMLDTYRLRPGQDIEAIIVPSSTYLHGVLQSLRRREIRIPHDIAVVGIDDELFLEANTPPITTIRLPFHEIGLEAGRMLLNLIAGETVPKEQTLAGDLVIRQSCGCIPPIITLANAGPRRNSPQYFNN